jgi:hypothetical protein
MKIHFLIAPFVMSLLLAAGCQERFDLSTLPQQPDGAIDTSYVQMTPSFPGFAGAEDIHIGYDQLLYVADTRANRIVMMNRAGQILSARAMLHPRSIAQDSRLDLLVGGELVATNGDTIGAIFRVHLVSLSPDSAHRLEVSHVDTVWREPAHPGRRFPGIAVFGDNQFLALRDGPDNGSFIDPDARVMWFDKTDRFITPLPALNTRVGSGITDINHPTAIASFPGVRDFVVAQSMEGVSYGALWLVFSSTSDFEGWLPRFDPARVEDRNVDFIRPNRFLAPEAIAIDRIRRDVYIADATLDSVMKFNNRGAFRSESFGIHRSGGGMRRPTGLAFFEKVLYVLDGQTGEILRYRLTSDIPR